MDWEETLTGSREGWLCAGWLIRHTRTAFIHSMHTAGRLQWNLVTRWGSSGHSRGKGMRAPLPRQIDASMTAGRHAANKARCVRVSAVETHHASPRCSYSLGVFPVRFTKPLAADAGLQDEAVGGVDCVRCHIAQHLLTQRWKRKAFIWIAGQPSARVPRPCKTPLLWGCRAYGTCTCPIRVGWIQEVDAQPRDLGLGLVANCEWGLVQRPHRHYETNSHRS